VPIIVGIRARTDDASSSEKVAVGVTLHVAEIGSCAAHLPMHDGKAVSVDVDQSGMVTAK
jgi:hypothetical protein